MAAQCCATQSFAIQWMVLLFNALFLSHLWECIINHIVAKVDSVGYISITSTTVTKLLNLVKRRLSAITRFKVIQGHRFWCQWNSYAISTVSINLTRILHRLRWWIIIDPIFAVDNGVPIFNALVAGKPPSLGWRNLTSRN